MSRCGWRTCRSRAACCWSVYGGRSPGDRVGVGVVGGLRRRAARQPDRGEPAERVVGLGRDLAVGVGDGERLLAARVQRRGRRPAHRVGHRRARGQRAGGRGVGGGGDVAVGVDGGQLPAVLVVGRRPTSPGTAGCPRSCTRRSTWVPVTCPPLVMAPERSHAGEGRRCRSRRRRCGCPTRCCARSDVVPHVPVDGR